MNILSSLISLVSAVAPTIANMLGGPLAGAAVSLIGSKILGTSAASIADIYNTLKSNPDQIIQLKQIEADLIKHGQDVDLEEFKLEHDIVMAQSDTNKIDAASNNWYQRNWRPTIGWVSALGWAYCTVGMAVVKSGIAISLLFGINPTLVTQVNAALPVLDASQMTSMILAMLGMAGWRSLDKKNGVAS